MLSTELGISERTRKARGSKGPIFCPKVVGSPAVEGKTKTPKAALENRLIWVEQRKQRSHLLRQSVWASPAIPQCHDKASFWIAGHSAIRISCSRSALTLCLDSLHLAWLQLLIWGTQFKKLFLVG